MTRSKKLREADRARGVSHAKRKVGADARCVVCGWQLPVESWRMWKVRVRGLHGHHVIPIADGGPPDESNVVMLCPNHHTVAHAIGDKVYRKWRGYESTLRTHDRLIRWLKLADTKPAQLTAELHKYYGAECPIPTPVLSITQRLSHGAVEAML